MGGNVTHEDGSESSLLAKAYEFRDRVAEMSVQTEGDFRNAAETTKQLKALQKEVKAYWEPLRVSAKDAYDAILAHKKAMMTPLEEAEKSIREMMADYTKRTELARRAEQEAVQAQAREEMVRMLEQARRARADGDEVTAQFAEAEAEVMQSMALTGAVSSVAPKAEGVTTQKRWVVESIDPQKVPIWYAGAELRPVDEKAISKVINASKGTVQIPGVTYREDVTFTIRA